MKLIGLLLNLAAITATALAQNNSDYLILSLSEHVVVRYTNESLIVQCKSLKHVENLHWKSPKNELIPDGRGRVHVEEGDDKSLKIVFTHIILGDKGSWTCMDEKHNKRPFDLIVYQKITFTENTTVVRVKEGNSATILCEVRGEPQPNITWSFNGMPISFDTKNTSKYRVLADGLLIHNVNRNDAGEYTCRAFQVNTIASDMQERTILLKTEHPPFWTHKTHPVKQYAYVNGSVDIVCEAISEPPPTFTWYRGNVKLDNNQRHTIENSDYASVLTVYAGRNEDFDIYTCVVKSGPKELRRKTILDRGEKPPPPTVLQLRGLNSNTFDVDVGSRYDANHPIRDKMDINGFRIEYMTEYDFKLEGGMWINPKRKDFPFEDGATFLIGNLEPNTTYYMRAATRNLAGFSDWTRVEKFQTISNEPPSSSQRLEHLTVAQILGISLVALLLSKELAFGFQNVASITKFIGNRSGMFEIL